MKNLGIKILTVENWLEADPIPEVFMKFSLNDSYTSIMTGEDWVAEFTSAQLGHNVPAEIRGLFETARGAMAYGFFFYPLFTLGGEQLFRVGESAISIRYTLDKGLSPRTTFEKKIEYLHQSGRITADERFAWTAIRKFRNIASHPERQSIYPPGFFAGVVRHLAKLINKLFP